ncbi:MAG: hypothetical protein KC505_05580 [Myxococcales bacterium]|nr:hypothetical protein [Myxococcales bacterium]USN50032.1 MAG: hypothetical protein H6731_07085 [Myxococcales bacterium]
MNKFSTPNTFEHQQSVSAKKRICTIIDSPQPLELVRSLSAHDIIGLVREVGAEDSLDLIALLSPSQVQEWLDLEIWQSDAVETQKAGTYFSLLFAADSQRAVNQMHGLDIELLALMFKMTSSIYDTTLGEEPIDFSELYSMSPDGRFIVCFDSSEEKRALSQSLHAYLESLYSRDLKRALGLLENIRFELASGLEETSLRLRQNRMLDMGILPREERLVFFAPLSANQLKSLDASCNEEGSKNFNQTLEIATKAFLDEFDDNYPFLQQAFNDASQKERQYFLDSLAYISINMHASLIDDFGDTSLIKSSASYVKSLLELGLFQACQGSIENAYKILLDNPIRDVIRVGRTSLTNLRKLLLSLKNSENYLMGDTFIRLDSPLREVAQALVLAEPRFYEGLLDANKFEVRFFSSLSDLNLTLKAVNEIKFRSLFIGPQILGCTNDMLKNNFTLSHASIFARFLVNSFFGHHNHLAEISSKEMLRLFAKPGCLDKDFVIFAKNFTEKLADKLIDGNHYETDMAIRLSQNFSTLVLIQMEQNYQLLLG